MTSLKDLRTRIRSVKSTQKITSAMKMVAASKLRRSREAVEGGRPFADSMEQMIQDLLLYSAEAQELPLLFTGKPDCAVHLLMIFTSDRGLCGGFNSTIVREAKKLIARLEAQGKIVKIFCIGKKGRDQLRREYGDKILETFVDVSKSGLTYDNAMTFTQRLLKGLESEEFGSISALYSVFKSALVQTVTHRPLVPFPVQERHQHLGYIHTLEPSVDAIIEQALPANLTSQLLRIFLESDASENGARTTAMDNATRNAKDVIEALQIKYNRTRQAIITKELIEIISGAESLK